MIGMALQFAPMGKLWGPHAQNR